MGAREAARVRHYPFCWVQTEQRADTFPDGSSGWHNVVITVN